VDYASGKIFNFPQYSNTASETIKSSLWLEAMVQEEGFCIKAYHSNNGISASPESKNHCAQHNQKYSFGGVGAEHQNGVAERNIKTVANGHVPTCFTWQPIGLNMPTQPTGLKQLTMWYGCSTDFQIWNLA
jgi:hypothetical protein